MAKKSFEMTRDCVFEREPRKKGEKVTAEETDKSVKYMLARGLIKPAAKKADKPK